MEIPLHTAGRPRQTAVLRGRKRAFEANSNDCVVDGIIAGSSTRAIFASTQSLAASPVYAIAGIMWRQTMSRTAIGN